VVTPGAGHGIFTSADAPHEDEALPELALPASHSAGVMINAPALASIEPKPGVPSANIVYLKRFS
jgi:hypothetical protein